MHSQWRAISSSLSASLSVFWAMCQRTCLRHPLIPANGVSDDWRRSRSLSDFLLGKICSQPNSSALAGSAHFLIAFTPCPEFLHLLNVSLYYKIQYLLSLPMWFVRFRNKTSRYFMHGIIYVSKGLNLVMLYFSKVLMLAHTCHSTHITSESIKTMIYFGNIVS